MLRGAGKAIAHAASLDGKARFLYGTASIN